MARSTVADILKMDTPLIVAKLRHSLTPPPPVLDAQGLPQPVGEPLLLPAVAANLDRIRGFGDVFDSTVNDAQDDPGKSAIGRSQVAAEAERAGEVSCVAFEQTEVAGLDRRIAADESTFLAKPAASTDVAGVLVRALRDMEIRDQVRALDAIQRDLLFRGTADPEVRSALASGPWMLTRTGHDAAPVFEAIISTEAQQDLAEAEAERRDPVRAATLRDLRSIRRVYASQLATLRRGMREVVSGVHA